MDKQNLTEQFSIRSQFLSVYGVVNATHIQNFHRTPNIIIDGFTTINQLKRIK